MRLIFSSCDNPERAQPPPIATDHLGSTSLTADVNGNKVLEIRYKAWGEIRATWTSSPSTTPAYKMPLYQYTGQAAYLDDPLTSGVTEGFGLMFYQSRFYDPQLGRFTQADTIVPGGVQGLDRYAAMNNNPIRYNDPSGHKPCWATSNYSCDAPIEKINKWRQENGYGPYHTVSRWRVIQPFAYGGCDAGSTYKECWYDAKLLNLENWQEIDKNQLMDLMFAVYYDLKHQSLGAVPLWKGFDDKYRGTYDTPFWNGKDAYGNPGEDQIVCIESSCFRRSDINYFAQGMWAAAAGETSDEAVADAASWKMSEYSEVLSPDTEFWVRQGYDAYLIFDALFGDLIESGDYDKYYNK